MYGFVAFIVLFCGCRFMEISALSVDDYLFAGDNFFARSDFPRMMRHPRPFRFITTLEQANEIPNPRFRPIGSPFSAFKDLPPVMLETTTTPRPTTTTSAFPPVGFPIGSNKLNKPFKKVKAPFNSMKGLPPSFFDLLVAQTTTTTTTTTTPRTMTSTTTPTTTTTSTTTTTFTTTPTTTTTTTTTTPTTTTSTTTPTTTTATTPTTTTTTTTPTTTTTTTTPTTTATTTTPTTTTTTTTTTPATTSSITTSTARTEVNKVATARSCSPDVLAANWHGIVPVGQCVTLEEIDAVCQTLFSSMFEAAASSGCPATSWCCYRAPVNAVQ